MAQGTKKKSRLWSLKEIKKVAEIIESAIASGKSRNAAMDEAAAHFGVTRNAIHIRYGRYKKGESMTRVKRNTAKTSTKGVKRGPYGKRRKYTKKPLINAIIDDGGISRVKRKYTKRTGSNWAPKVDTGRSMTFKITNVQVDLSKGEITVSY
jgi:hypothetical protein